MKPVMVNGAWTIVALAMLQQDGLDVGVAGKQRDEFPAAIAAESDNSDGGPEHFLQYAMFECLGNTFGGVDKMSAG
jgi:hypothetical protein